jgi:hypothetical protein
MNAEIVIAILYYFKVDFVKNFACLRLLIDETLRERKKNII